VGRAMLGTGAYRVVQMQVQGQLQGQLQGQGQGQGQGQVQGQGQGQVQGQGQGQGQGLVWGTGGVPDSGALEGIPEGCLTWLTIGHGPFSDADTIPLVSLDGRMRKLASMRAELEGVVQEWNEGRAAARAGTPPTAPTNPPPLDAAPRHTGRTRTAGRRHGGPGLRGACGVRAIAGHPAPCPGTP